jgi:serine/threonine-protein kinase
MPDDEILALARTRLGRGLRGKYRLDRVLGVGGMAVVYAATHRNKKRFAIKMLHPELSMREGIRTRFLREGYVANSVEHSGAVAVLDDDVAEDGSAFVVMELLDGSAIDVLWEKHGKRVPLSLVLSIGDALLEVLAAAHAKGVVHRDIKPANLFLTSDGALRVLDFGIARLHDETSSSATATGVTMGTPAYMAPEQALGESHNVDGKTDLWAVGATLFTLLTGELVHPAENPSHLLVNAATKKAREISSVSGDVPKRIAGVLDGALAFDKKDRWAGAKEMREALQQACLAETGAPIAPLPKTEKVTGLEETMASDPDVARHAGGSGGNLGFDPTVDSGAISARKVVALSAGVGMAETKPSARAASGAWVRWGLGVAGLLAVAGGAVAVLGPRKAQQNATPSAVPSAASSEPRPGRPPATPAAAAAFEAALQADHDGNLPEVERSLTAAVASDPALGAAHLRLVLHYAGDNRESEAHAAYQKTLDHRATLGEIDAALLDAWEPRFRDPPDRAERTKRMTEVAKKYPKDVFIQTELADSLAASGQYPAAVEQADRALALDPRYVRAMAEKIWILNHVGDEVKARQVADECVKVSSSAVSCLLLRMTMSYDEGRCAELKADARHVIAIDPTSQQGYASLADAMAALGESMDSVAEALKRSDGQTQDPDDRRLSELSSKELLALMQGDLAGAESADGEAVAFAASRPNLDATRPAIKQVGIVLEEGDLARARSLAKMVRAKLASSGMGEPDVPVEGKLATLFRRAGGMTRDQLHIEQQRLIGYQNEADEHRGGKTDPFRTWGWIYAGDIEDEGDAADALAALTKAGGVDPKFSNNPFFSQGLGAMYAFAGHGAEAIPYLEKAGASCYQLDEVMDLTHDSYALGVAREQTGDLPGARAAYQRVLDRWGGAKPRSVTADKARTRLAALAKKN